MTFQCSRHFARRAAREFAQASAFARARTQCDKLVQATQESGDVRRAFCVSSDDDILRAGVAMLDGRGLQRIECPGATGEKPDNVPRS